MVMIRLKGSLHKKISLLEMSICQHDIVLFVAVQRSHGAVTTQSSSQWKARKTEQASHVHSSASLETIHHGLMFPKLTISPLRRFQLLDSDHSSVSEDVIKRDYRIDPPSKQSESTASEQTREVSAF